MPDLHIIMEEQNFFREVNSIKGKNRRDSYFLDQLPEEVRSQLALLDDAEFNLLFILVSIVLRIQTLQVQRGLLLAETFSPGEFDASAYPDPFVMQVVASVLTFYALIGFQKQPQEIAAQTAAAGQDTSAADTESLLSMIVILVSLVRFGFLLDTANAEQGQAAPLELEAELEDI